MATQKHLQKEIQIWRHSGTAHGFFTMAMCLLTLPRQFISCVQRIRWLFSLSLPTAQTCNFFLFPKLKSALKRRRFDTIDNINKFVTGITRHSRENFPDRFVQWRHLGKSVWIVEWSTLKGTRISNPKSNNKSQENIARPFSEHTSFTGCLSSMKRNTSQTQQWNKIAYLFCFYIVPLLVENEDSYSILRLVYWFCNAICTAQNTTHMAVWPWWFPLFDFWIWH